MICTPGVAIYFNLPPADGIFRSDNLNHGKAMERIFLITLKVSQDYADS
ncbi:hypothetical protein NOC27_2137 [Nitrosococcus oceani AFC27]|nr:hypothetical protein NOC27_2137 [Nitrosococcus oceani AFC27]